MPRVLGAGSMGDLMKALHEASNPRPKRLNMRESSLKQIEWYRRQIQRQERIIAMLDDIGAERVDALVNLIGEDHDDTNPDANADAITHGPHGPGCCCPHVDDGDGNERKM